MAIAGNLVGYVVFSPSQNRGEVPNIDVHPISSIPTLVGWVHVDNGSEEGFSSNDAGGGRSNDVND